MTLIINDRFDVDAEIAQARERVYKVIERVIHFPARSSGQKRRREREKRKQPANLSAPTVYFVFSRIP